MNNIKLNLVTKTLILVLVLFFLTIIIVSCNQADDEGIKLINPVTITFVGQDGNATIIGKTVQRIEKDTYSSEVTAIANMGYKFVNWSNGETDRTISIKSDKDVTIVANVVKDDNQYPVLSINTENGATIDSKKNWVKCSISTSLTSDEYTISNEEAKIKGRGNSTWGMPKKPYKFKFSSKTNLFGMGKAKNWVLLANYCDPSSLRNAIAYSLGNVIEESKMSTMDYVFVEVVLNGEYVGVYQLCEQIEVQSKRVDIDDDTTKVDTGYILELDFRMANEGVENVDYFKCNGSCYAVKDPDPDDTLTQEQMTFIKDYVISANAAVHSDDYDDVLEYIDVDTFAATYIVHELFNCVDVGGLSFYLYKDAGGKLCSGPLWDFDISSGNSDYVPSAVDPETIFAGSCNEWYRELLEFDEFKELIEDYLIQYEEDIVDKIVSICEDSLDSCEAYYRNYNKWQTLGTYVWPNTQELVDIKTWEGHVEYLKGWLLESIEFMVDCYVVSE